MAEIYFTRGKGDFVTWENEKGLVQICNNVWNADGSDGCIAQVPPALMDEVMDNEGKYAQETIKKWKNNPIGKKFLDGRCTYCYDKRKNRKNVLPKTVGENTRKEFEEKQPEFLRLSKSTEFGHPIYRESLINLLDLCIEYKTRPILPTKMLNFDMAVGDRVIASKGMIGYSLGYNFMEKGVIGLGFTNKERVKQAELYQEHGVNTTLTLAVDVTDSFENNAERGSAILNFLTSSTKVKRIIPMRLTSEEVALKVTGIEWDDLLNPENAVGYIKEWSKYSPEVQERIKNRPYIQRESNNGGKGNNTLIARFAHSDFQPYLDEKRVCGQIGDLEFCDKCNLANPSEFISFPISELKKVKYENPEKLQNKRKPLAKNRKGLEKNSGEKKRTIERKLDF